MGSRPVAPRKYRKIVKARRERIDVCGPAMWKIFVSIDNTQIVTLRMTNVYVTKSDSKNCKIRGGFVDFFWLFVHQSPRLEVQLLDY